MAFQLYHDRAAILAGFLLVVALFSTAFLIGEDDTSLTGYVVMDHGPRISTAKMDAALVKEIVQGNTTPHVIVLLEDEEQLLENVSQVKDKQQLFLGELNYKMNVAHVNESEVQQETDFVLKKTFENTNAVAGQIKSADALLEITKSARVKKIILDYPVQVSLDQSASWIGADHAWNLQYTGNGLSACVVDTGVQYDHHAFGSCQAQSVIQQGNIVTIDPVESSHPYQNNVVQTFTITQPGFENIALHFSNISLEQIGQSDTLDRVYILDAQDSIVAIYKGEKTNIWTPHVQGDTIKIQLVSDGSISSYGFYVDQALNGTTNTTIDWSNCSAIIGGYDTFNDDTDPYDGQGHGTHVAGIIASRDQTYRGIAPNATLAVVKALSDRGSGYGSDIVAGLEWCVSNAQKFNISVISMSLGCAGANCPHYQNYCENDITAPLIQQATNQNISVVIASGNDGWHDGISNPSCAPGAIPVGAVDQDDRVIFNRGELLDIVAPGKSITSTYRDNGFSSLSGTSMATPHVSGALLLLHQFAQQHNLSTSPSSLRSLLVENGLKSFDTNSNKNYSRIDLHHFFQIEQNQTVNEQSSTYLLHSPLNNSYYNSSFFVNVTAQNVSSFVLSFANITIHSNESLQQQVSLDDANYSINSSVTYLNGTVISESFDFVVDTTVPLVTYSVLNDSNEYTLNITVRDAHLKRSSFHSNFSGEWSNVTFSDNHTFIHTFSVEQPGSFFVSASDFSGNVYSTPHVNLIPISAPTEVVTIIKPQNDSEHVPGLIVFKSSHNGTWIFEDGQITNTSHSKNFTSGVYTVEFHSLNQTKSVSFIVEEQNSVPVISQMLFQPQIHKEKEGAQIITAQIDDDDFFSASIDLDSVSYDAECETVENQTQCSWILDQYHEGENNFVLTARDEKGSLSSQSDSFIGMSCLDGIQNGDEEGIDCGGVCQEICTAVTDKIDVKSSPSQYEIQELSQDVATTSTVDLQDQKKSEQESNVQEKKQNTLVSSSIKEESQNLKTNALYFLWTLIALVGVVYALFIPRK